MISGSIDEVASSLLSTGSTEISCFTIRAPDSNFGSSMTTGSDSGNSVISKFAF
jgi:hypothetical protein